MSVIVWIILGAIAGAAAVVFWDKLKEWATNATAFLLDTINTLVEVIGGGVVYFIKEGKKFYQALDLYTKEREGQEYYVREYPRKEVNKSEIPQGILNQIDEKEKLPVLELKT